MPDPENPPKFDPDFLPDNPYNRQVAEDRGLRYDPSKQSYVDEDGCQIADRYGQSY